MCVNSSHIVPCRRAAHYYRNMPRFSPSRWHSRRQSQCKSSSTCQPSPSDLSSCADTSSAAEFSVLSDESFTPFRATVLPVSSGDHLSLAMPSHSSCSAFRTALLARPSRSREVVVNTGARFKLLPTPSGGSCGFLAVAWALLIAGIPGACGNPSAMRNVLATHVCSNREVYVTALQEHGYSVSGDTVESADRNREEATGSTWLDKVALFERSVVVGGIDGHWLGQYWGDLEILALARALQITIDLYTFDTNLQQVRQYFRARCEEGKYVELTVSLLFTGKADSGHFDLLQEISPKQAFRCRFGKRL